MTRYIACSSRKKIIEALSTLQNKGRLTQNNAFKHLQYVQITIRILECLTRTLPQPNLAGMAVG